MSLPSRWNGEIPAHRDQYEQITESFIDGHLNFNYDDIDPKLITMENPYSKETRDQEGVSYHWDHAFYNGQYYMYFGVVPVFLLFLPYRLITGTSLTTYHATQIFVIGFTLGLFALLWNITKKFFKDLPLSVYLSLALILSLVCVKYSIKFPALYHTAISSGMFLEIWSLYWYTRAVWFAKDERSALLAAGFGALLGALAFGYRPSLALGNIAIIPFIIAFLNNRPTGSKIITRLGCVFLPYVIIAIALMAYNYARFDNPFEFGQSYQLTSADQSDYSNWSSQIDLVKIINGLIFSFAYSPTVSEKLPYISHGGVLWECPVLLLGLAGVFDNKTRNRIREVKLSGFLWALFIAVVTIIIIQTAWSPRLLNRYSEDYMWLLAIMVFIVVAFWLSGTAEESKLCGVVCWCSFATFFITFLLFLIPENASLTVDQPDILRRVASVLRLGLSVT